MLTLYNYLRVLCSLIPPELIYDSGIPSYRKKKNDSERLIKIKILRGYLANKRNDTEDFILVSMRSILN